MYLLECPVSDVEVAVPPVLWQSNMPIPYMLQFSEIVLPNLICFNNGHFSTHTCEAYLTDWLLALTYSFFAFFSLLEKTETLEKKGTHIQKKVPGRTQISWRGPIWEQCKCWKPFLGVYLQLSSLLSRLWSEGGTGQDGGARPKLLQSKICHCFVNFLWFFSNFFAPGS